MKITEAILQSFILTPPRELRPNSTPKAMATRRGTGVLLRAMRALTKA